jgi:hypothetical protein
MTNKHSYGHYFPRTFQLPSSNQTWRAEKSTPIDDFPIETSIYSGFPSLPCLSTGGSPGPNSLHGQGYLFLVRSVFQSLARQGRWVLATGDEMKPPQNWTIYMIKEWGVYNKNIMGCMYIIVYMYTHNLVWYLELSETGGLTPMSGMAILIGTTFTSEWITWRNPAVFRTKTSGFGT